MRETSDMVIVLPTESTKDTKIKMHMKSENIEPQNTQKCAEIYGWHRLGNGRDEGKLSAVLPKREVDRLHCTW